MYDVAIVGAGLSGLALAEMLEAQGQSVLVLEARERLGGRILTEIDPDSGLAVDLGPTWFWPHRQPLMAGIIQRLEIPSFPQKDDGINLSLRDVGKGPQKTPPMPLHDGAHRLIGGMAQLSKAVAASLSQTEIRLGHVVQAVFDEAGHVRISWCSSQGTGEVLAKRCVMALPPRLVGSLTFSPALDRATLSALQHTQTWMATSAKVAVTCASRSGAKMASRVRLSSPTNRRSSPKPGTPAMPRATAPGWAASSASRHPCAAISLQDCRC